MWLHGGGMISGGIDGDRPVCERYALDIGRVVVSMQYRLAPEDPYPAGAEDCYAALLWTAQHAVVFQALTYPMLDDRNNTSSAREFHSIPAGADSTTTAPGGPYSE